MREIPYIREKSITYAHQWALGRNSSYLDFSNLGGDCTKLGFQINHTEQSDHPEAAKNGLSIPIL